MDFTTDDLQTFMQAPSPSTQSHERSTGSPDDSYRHNIFDTSAPSSSSAAAAAAAASTGFPIHYPRSSQHDGSPHSFGANGGSPHDSSSFTHQNSAAAHFHINSTLAPLGSSVRYEPLPDPPPSAFPHGFQRQTPSPGASSRSRSRSRPPSTGVGPQRTTRTRRNNSVSSASPPPHGAHWQSMMGGIGMPTNAFGTAPPPPPPGAMNGSRPQAIVIPRSNSSHSQNNNGGTPVSPWDYTLPTPDSLHSHSSHLPPPLPPIHHHHHHQGGGQQPHYGSMPTSYGNFGMGMSPTELPPVSALGGLGTPTSLTSSVLSASPPSSIAPPPQEKATSASEKQSLLASEKRRRRRESHNAVERRRRDNINEKISELATLIPISMLEGAAASEKGSQNQNGLMSIPIRSQNNNNNNNNSDGGENGSGSNTMSPISPTGLPMSPTDSENPLSELWGKESSPGEAATKKEDGMNVLGDLGPNASGTAPTSVAGGPTADGGVVKANKGMILRKSVEYIRYLQQLVNAQGARNRELEEELHGYRATGAVPAPTSSSSSNENGQGHVNGSSSLNVHSGGASGARTPTPGDIGMSFSMGNYGMDKFGMFGLENLHENEQEEEVDVMDDDEDEGSDYEEQRRGRKERRGKGDNDDGAGAKRATRSSAKSTKKSVGLNGMHADEEMMNGHHGHHGREDEVAEVKMEL